MGKQIQKPEKCIKVSKQCNGVVLKYHAEGLHEVPT